MKLPALLLALGPLLAAASAFAQDFPTKPIKIVIPFTAGGGVDTIMRAMGPALSTALGQPIVIDNKPGAGAQIAVSALQQAPADGYTLFAAPGGAFALNPHLYKKLTYNPITDFDAVATLLTTPMVMFAHPANKAGTLEGFRQAMNGGSIKYASPGLGTAPHLFGSLIGNSAPKAQFLHVPYRGAPQAIQAVLGQEVDVMFDAVPSVIGLSKGGQVRAIAIASDQRHPLYPEVPTLKEAGLPQISMDFWVGVVTRKGTPEPVIRKLHQAFEKVMSDPAVLGQFESRGYTRLSMTPVQFNGLIRSELAKYGPIVRETGATID